MLVGAAAVTAVLALGSCATADGTASSPGVVEDSVGAPAGIPGFQDGADGERGGTGGGLVSEPAEDRSVIVTGTVRVTADDPLAASTEATRIVEAAGGRVDARREHAPSEFRAGGASLQLRIPADRLDDVIEELRGLGRADSVDIESVDVTTVRQDVDARIRALSTSIERLTALMVEADDMSDIILLESELSSRQGELESLQAQQRHLADQTSMSTIWLELQAPADARDPAPDGFGDGLVVGWNAFVAFWSAALVVLGILVPWLVLAGIATLVLILLLRRRRRRAGAEIDPAA